jgi:putative component of toxin-antitoxin plasmid stabilization module
MSQSDSPHCAKGVLTYMSIREEWQKFRAEGFLHEVEPFPGDPSTRTVLVSSELQALLDGPWEGEQGKRCAILTASLQQIVVGAKLVVEMDPYQAREANMGRLDPVEDGVWDIRCRRSPGIRTFCFFLERDVIVAFFCSPRSKPVPWLHRLPLGFGDSIEWKRAVAESKREWAKLFPAHEPVRGDDLDAYLSNAVHERD